MVNQQHLDLLKQGAYTWNLWLAENPDIQPDFAGANLSEVNISGAYLVAAVLVGANLFKTQLDKANLRGAFLYNANLNEAILSEANLSEAQLMGVQLHRAILCEANLYKANLNGADLNGANLSKANLEEAQFIGSDLRYVNMINAKLDKAILSRADLSGADLTGADLSDADLTHARLVQTNFETANLTNCSIFGISAWNVQLKDAIQANLIITDDKEPIITVDNLAIAQFIYLLLNNEKIRDVIDAITSKVVLILGRFTNERKKVLDALRDELRKRNYTPVLFDFEKPANRDVTETVATLAHMARFIIADITEPKSIPQELSHIVPFLPSVPIVPLLPTGCATSLWKS